MSTTFCTITMNLNGSVKCKKGDGAKEVQCTERKKSCSNYENLWPRHVFVNAWYMDKEKNEQSITLEHYLKTRLFCTSVFAKHCILSPYYKTFAIINNS